MFNIANWQTCFCSIMIAVSYYMWHQLAQFIINIIQGAFAEPPFVFLVTVIIWCCFNQVSYNKLRVRTNEHV
jgi:hypothetical protein